MRAVVFASPSVAVLLWLGMAGPAVALDGWSRSVDGGTTFFACRSRACGRDAVISCRVVGGNAVTSTEQYTARVRSQIEALRGAGRQVEAGETSRSVLGDRVLFQAAYFVRVPGGPRGEQFRSGFLVGPTETFSIVSSSADAKTTRGNFDRFVARLASRPSAESVAECLP